MIRNEDSISACWSIRKIELTPPDYQTHLDELLQKMNMKVEVNGGYEEDNYDGSNTSDFV